MLKSVKPPHPDKEFKPSWFWGRVDFYVKLCAFTLSIVGGTVALGTYISNQMALRDQRAFDIVAIYDQASTQQAAASLSSDIEGLLTDLRPNIDAAMIGDVLYRSYTGGASVQKRSEFIRIWYLVRRVSHCHAQRSCDQALLEDYFCDFVGSFWRYFKTPIISTNETDETANIDAFVISCAQSPDELSAWRLFSW